MRCRFDSLFAGIIVLAPLTLAGCDGGGTTEPPSLCESQSEIPVDQCEALVSLFESTNGPAWMVSAGWLETETPCSWFGVVCGAGLVEELDLGANGLEGEFPTAVTRLSGLVRLNLSGNALTGTIPSGLGGLTALENLQLADNDLSGPIPPELGSLENLVFLYLFSNRLSGPIPVELADLSSLKMLFLRNNELTGSIPAELATLPALQRLVVSNNELTGTIPPELGDLLGLDTFWIQGNDLEGAVPLAVAQLGASIQAEYGASTCDARPGNDGLFIPDEDAYRAADMDGDGFICAVAVPAGG